MGSADFSQFVVTTANEAACETSTLKVLALSPHLPATSTGTSSNFWTSSLFADLSVFPSLICGSCPSGQGFAYSFLQIPPRGGHPCCSAMYFVVACAYSGLSPVRARPWRANQKSAPPVKRRSFLFADVLYDYGCDHHADADDPGCLQGFPVGKHSYERRYDRLDRRIDRGSAGFYRCKPCGVQHI